MSFLSEHDLRPLELGDGCPFRPLGLALGKGAQAVDVALLTADHKPSLTDLRELWRARHRSRATPLLVVVLYDERAAICGPAGDQPPAYTDLEPDLVERICRAALEEPDRHAALRRLHSVIPNVKAPLAGLRNEGLFATNVLEHDVRRRSDWPDANSRATPVLRERGGALLRALGFSVEPLTAGPGSILRAAGTRTALAIFLDQNESPETPSRRFSDHSPITWALNVADQERLRYVIVCNGAQVRLYLTELGRGVGQRARTETYVEIDLDFLKSAEAGYLWLLFSASALSAGGSVEEILEQSRSFAAELGDRLRDSVYQDAIPRLAKALLAARGLTHPNAEQLAETYQMALLLLFRLLFVAYAEDRDLLPFRTNGLYETRSLKHKATELAELARKSENIATIQHGEPFDRGNSLWEEVNQLFNAINQGHSEWGVPAYNGGLFLNDKEISPLGYALAQIKLSNRDFGPVLFYLLVDQAREGWGPVDFRSLSVREFGTIYEGLLENELSVAPADLAVTPKGEYRLARTKDEITVRAGELYPHTPSGARKSTSSTVAKQVMGARKNELAMGARKNELAMGAGKVAKRRRTLLFRVATEQWLASKKHLWSRNTLRLHENLLKPLLAEFGGRLVCDIDAESIAAYQQKRLAQKCRGSERKVSASTVNHEIGTLRQVLKSQKLWRDLQDDVKLLKERTDVGKALSYEDEERLIEAIGQSRAPGLLTMFVLAVDSGLRADELRNLRHRDLGLTWSNGAIESGWLTVSKSKTDAGRGRTVPLTRRACSALTVWLARFPEAGPDSYVFPAYKVGVNGNKREAHAYGFDLGKPIGDWGKAWENACAKAKVRCRWHDLRHTFVTRLLENPSVSEQTAMALAGHISKSMLARYSHIRQVAKEAAIATLERDDFEAGLLQNSLQSSDGDSDQRFAVPEKALN
jgi:integrase